MAYGRKAMYKLDFEILESGAPLHHLALALPDRQVDDERNPTTTKISLGRRDHARTS